MKKVYAVQELFENAEQYEDYVFDHRIVKMAKTRRIAENLCFKRREEVIKNYILSDRNEDEEHKHSFGKEASIDYCETECEPKIVCSMHVEHKWPDETANYWWRVLEFDLES